MPHASICGRFRAPGPSPSAPKQWKSDVQREIATDEIQERNIIESAAILKRACQCTDGISAMQNEFQHPPGIETMSPDSL